MSSEQRDTFKQFSEIVDEMAQHLEAVASTLESVRAKDVEERLDILLETWISEERSLTGRLREFANDMDDEAAGEYAQFTPDVDTDDVAELPKDLTRTSLTQWLLEEHDRIAGMFRKLSETASADAAKESANSLLELMEGHDKRLARESSDSEDI